MSNFTRPTLPTRVSAFCRRLLPMILLAPVAVLLGAWSFQDGEEKVTIKGQDVPLLTVFKSIKKQTGYNFFYAANFVNDKEKVSVDMQNARVDDVLRKVLGHDYTWVYNENAVSITKKKGEVKRNEAPAVPVKDSSVNQITVSGSVTDAKGTPIPGATVMVKGTHDGASTDEDGHFSLAGVRPDAVLVISSVGFERREIPVKGKTILAKLNVSVNDLDEAVVVAYGETTQRANTGAVTVVRGEQIQNLPNRSFDKSLQGMVPGLQITNGTGQPGGGVSNMVLRGIATGSEAKFGSTVRNPLIVIDGIPVIQDYFQITTGEFNTPLTNPLAQVNTSDIETITVLKDASAIALYGSKASNGVILVTTKKGKAGKTRFNFRHQTDVSSRLKDKIDVLDQEEYLNLLYEAYRNSNATLWTDQAIRSDLLSKFPYVISVNGDTSFYPAQDWQGALYLDHAVTVTNEISMAGGNDKTNYYLNIEYTDQEGIVKSTGYKRGAARFNFENNPVNWLKLGVNTTFSYNKQQYAGNIFESGTSYGLLPIISPLNPISYKDSGYVLNYPYGTTASALSPMANPVAEAEYNINRVVSYRGLSKFYGEINFLKYFKFLPTLGVDFMLSETKEKVDPRLATGGVSIGNGQIQDYDLRRTSLITTNLLKYDRLYGQHHTVNILLGQEAQVFTQKNLLVRVQGLLLPYYDQVSNGSTISSYSGSEYKETLLSFFGQANYSYADKYFFSSSLRRDGSSKFGDQQRFGTYWSAGAGWVVTQEPFIQKITPFLNYFKIRGSLGIAGNSAAISRLTRYDQLGTGSYLGNNAVLPYSSSPGNPDIQWEETFNWDLGLETRLFSERVRITADFYKRKTSKLIYTIDLAPVTGYLSVLDNIGDIENKGTELSLGVDIIRERNFNWNFSINWSTNKNRLIRQSQPLVATGSLINKEGENFNSFYLVRWAGVDPADGKPQWLDSTGKVTKSYNLADRVITGKPQPDAFGGITNNFRYRNFELSLFFSYKYGFQVYDGLSSTLVSDGAFPYINQSKKTLDRWQKPGDNASNPRRMLNNTDYGNAASTRYLFDGDYIRLEALSLAYTFPQKVISNISLTNLRIYMQAYNLFLWTRSEGQDPDLVNTGGVVNSPYPRQRSFSFGLNVSL